MRAITVSQVPAAIVIAVDPEATTLTEIDQTLQLAAMVTDAKDVAIEDAAVSWSSSNESVATVDGDGLVTAVGNGMADITATAGEVSGMVSISVMAPSPDREALIAIYNATNGPNWTRQDNWLSEAPISTWQGITTNDMDRVTKVYLAAVGMAGSIPTEFGQLAHLDSLYVTGNDLTGSIPPELSQLDRLVMMNLSGNKLTGSIPAELGQMIKLTEMYLSINQLSGPIPPELGQLTNMDWLYISDNELSGPIPPELGQLTKLDRFSLASNNLSGEIPPELGQLANIRDLNLSMNNLTGTVPAELGGLPRHTILKLNGNADLSGPLPRSFLDSPLGLLWLQGTMICIPPDAEFQAWLAGMTDAQGISTCEVDDGDDGQVTYVPWTGVKVAPGQLDFSASGGFSIPLTDCFTKNSLIGGLAPFPPEGLKDWFNSVTDDTLTVHYSVWQRSGDMGNTWTDIEATRVVYDACPYDPEVAGEYRLVGDITLNGDRAFRRSENTFVVP